MYLQFKHIIQYYMISQKKHIELAQMDFNPQYLCTV